MNLVCNHLHKEMKMKNFWIAFVATAVVLSIGKLIALSVEFGEESGIVISTALLGAAIGFMLVER